MLIIGLTGGIGSGKSTAADFFAHLGVPVFDADALAHELVQPGQPALEKIITEFGREILNPDGTLNRTHLRAVVFSDPDQRLRLEAILHPLIRQRFKEKITQIDAPYCILSIPLLLETHQEDMVNRILVIDAPESLQIARTQERNGLSATEVKKILSAQAKRKQRLAAADDIVVNDGDLPRLKAQVSELHQKYLHIAQNTKKPR
jgi:dephospho-CoA kinase